MIHPPKYTYTTKIISTIWGFIHKKRHDIHSPVNSKTPGKLIKPEETTQWTAMKPPALNPLQMLIIGK